ncbi:hypothetical protein WME95_20705 [Sorangium sp. So ce327]|uniref:hypothetical protein n=1 Tax=Sorangium sp. So ce327 TaxID=3133301 RepID=UPI003F5E948B
MKATIPWFGHGMRAAGSAFIVEVFAIVCVVRNNCVTHGSAEKFCELNCLRGLHRLHRICIACNILRSCHQGGGG